MIGVGIVVCLGLILALIAILSRNRHRRSHQQQHQGLFASSGGGKARQEINKRKQIFKPHRKPRELAGEEVANELEGDKRVDEIDGMERLEMEGNGGVY